MSEEFQTEPLQAGDEKSGFTCGQKALDRYFAKHALNNDQLGIGKTFVLRGKEEEEPKILGFYVLSMASVQSPQIGEVMQKKLPRYPNACGASWSFGSPPAGSGSRSRRISLDGRSEQSHQQRANHRLHRHDCRCQRRPGSGLL